MFLMKRMGWIKMLQVDFEDARLYISKDYTEMLFYEMLPENKQGHLTIVFWKFVPDFLSAKPIRCIFNKTTICNS